MSSPDICAIKKYAGDDDSCIVKHHKRLQLLIPPLYANSLSKGVTYALAELMKGYCKRLNGLLLGYENLKVLQESGWVHSTNPFIHLHVQADFYVFAPKSGAIVQGVVTDIGRNRANFLLYDKYPVLVNMYEINKLLEKLMKSRNPSAHTCRDARNKLTRTFTGLRKDSVHSLMLYVIALRDFIPILKAVPVIDGVDLSVILTALSTPLNSIEVEVTATPSRKKVRFSDEEDSSRRSDEDSIRNMTKRFGASEVFDTEAKLDGSGDSDDDSSDSDDKLSKIDMSIVKTEKDSSMSDDSVSNKGIFSKSCKNKIEHCNDGKNSADNCRIPNKNLSKNSSKIKSSNVDICNGSLSNVKEETVNNENSINLSLGMSELGRMLIRQVKSAKGCSDESSSKPKGLKRKACDDSVDLELSFSKNRKRRKV